MGDSDQFPGLHFDPTPGSPPGVDALAGQLQVAVDHLANSTQAIDAALGATTAWTGPAADNMRRALADIRPRVIRGQTAFVTAHNVLTAWSKHLTVLQQRRAGLEAQAVAARHRWEQAKANPAHDLTYFQIVLLGHDDTERQTMTAQMEAADRAVADAKALLDDIVEVAHVLKDEHDSEAKAVAKVIRDAAKTAPQEPDHRNWLEKAGDGISDAVSGIPDGLNQLGDWTSEASFWVGVVGDAALFLPPPLDLASPYLAGWSSGLSLAALGLHTSAWLTGADVPPSSFAKDGLGALPYVGPWGMSWYYFRSPPATVDAIAKAAGMDGYIEKLTGFSPIGVIDNINGGSSPRGVFVAPLSPEEKAFQDSLRQEEARLAAEPK